MIKQIFSAIFFLGVFVVTIAAQNSIEDGLLRARDQFTDIRNRSTELERVKRDAADSPKSGEYTVDFPKIKEDFEQIQKINSDVLQSKSVKLRTNYAVVLKSVSEINHRAARLRTNLFSAVAKPKTEEKTAPQNIFQTPEMNLLLKSLDESINRFVHNSIFQNLNLVNPQDSINAENDLEKVIALSFSIREKARELKENLASQ